MTRTFGYLQIVIYLLHTSSLLHFWHLYPHFPIYSSDVKSIRHSPRVVCLVDKLCFECLGIGMLKSIKLSKARDENPHFLHYILDISYPSKISVITESSLLLLCFHQISLYSLHEGIVYWLCFEKSISL